MDTLPQTPVGILGQYTGRAPAGIMPVIIQAKGRERQNESLLYVYIIYYCYFLVVEKRLGYCPDP